MVLDDYVFRVEESVGDSYNLRTRYSLRRVDGEPIEPDLRFESTENSAFGGNSSRICAYRLSEDGKTLWMDEEISSSQRQKDGKRHIITLENLVRSDEENPVVLEFRRMVSYRANLTDEIRKFGNLPWDIQNSEMETYRISHIQLSRFGLHMEMKTPKPKLSEEKHFPDLTVSLLMQDGTVQPLENLHFGSRGNSESRRYDATCETMFDAPISLDDVRSLLVCGQPIPVRSDQ